MVTFGKFTVLYINFGIFGHSKVIREYSPFHLVLFFVIYFIFENYICGAVDQIPALTHHRLDLYHCAVICHIFYSDSEQVLNSYAVFILIQNKCIHLLKCIHL